MRRTTYVTAAGLRRIAVCLILGVFGSDSIADGAVLLPNLDVATCEFRYLDLCFYRRTIQNLVFEGN